MLLFSQNMARNAIFFGKNLLKVRKQNILSEIYKSMSDIV